MRTEKTLDIRPSPIAGSWYPGTEASLRRALAQYLEPESKKLSSSDALIALIVPHAGYVYSGATAGKAFQALHGKAYQKVVVISPSHRAYSDALLTTAHDAYKTPLGLVPVDHEALVKLNKALKAHGQSLKAIRFDQEHALEIELPFLQYLLGDSFELIPIMMPDQKQNTAQALAQALFELISSFEEDKKVLLVASTDLSHFYTHNRAKQLDGEFIKAIEAMDVNQLYKAHDTGKTEACGLGPVGTVLTLSKLLGANKLEICDYRDSSHASGDKSAVVGYVSATISREDKENA